MDRKAGNVEGVGTNESAFIFITAVSDRVERGEGGGADQCKLDY